MCLEPWNAVIETGFVSEATFGQKFRHLSVELIQHDDNMIDEVDYDGDDEMTNDDKVEHLETISSACARTAAPICTDFLHRDV